MDADGKVSNHGVSEIRGTRRRGRYWLAGQAVAGRMEPERRTGAWPSRSFLPHPAAMFMVIRYANKGWRSRGILRNGEPNYWPRRSAKAAKTRRKEWFAQRRRAAEETLLEKISRR